MTFPAFAAITVAIAAVTVAGATRVRQRKVAAAISIGGALALAAINAETYLRHYGDDAYITLRYARNLARGIGPVWNDGERVEGYTSFAWMGLIAGLNKLGADPVDASIWLSYGSMLLTLAVVWRITSMWGRDHAVLAAPAVLAVTALLIATNDAVVFWGFSGLETPLAGALLTLTAWLAMREARGARFPAYALAAAAASMTRPEMLAVAGVTAAFAALPRAGDGTEVSVVRTPGRGMLRPYIDDVSAYVRRVDLRRFALWCGLFALTFGAYFAWRYAYYGHVFPNTYYAKVGSDIEFLNRGAGYLQGYAMSYLFVPFVAGVLVLAAAGAPAVRRDAIYVLAVVAAWSAAVVVEGGDAFFHGRFLAPLIPLLYVAGVCGLTLALERALPERRQFAAVGLAVASIALLALLRSNADPTLAADRRAHDDRVALGRWVRDNVPRDYRIASFASGAVQYYADAPALDMLGLTDETIAHTDVPDFGRGIAGHEKHNIPYVLFEARPEVILLGDSYPFVLSRERLGTVSQSIAAYRELIAHPATFDLYEPAAIERDGRYFSFLLRKDVLGSVRVDWTESGGLAQR